MPDINAEPHSTCAVTGNTQVRMQRWRPAVNCRFAKATICDRPNCNRIIQPWARPDDDRFCSGTCHRAVRDDGVIADVARAAAAAATAALPSGGAVRSHSAKALAFCIWHFVLPQILEISLQYSIESNNLMKYHSAGSQEASTTWIIQMI